MSKIMIPICSCALFFFCISGCSGKKTEIEVTKENFSKFFSSKFVRAFILCAPFKRDLNRFPYYHYEFPINDPKKIRVILQCIKDANHMEFDRELFIKTTGKNSWLFVFETRKLRYSIHIGWDDKSAYGLWWESPELLNIFRGWGLFEDVAKADPNWPPAKWQTQPPKEQEPNRP